VDKLEAGVVYYSNPRMGHRSWGADWFLRHHDPITDDTGAKDGPIARITPEADEQVDGKGRTLVEIDAALEDVFEELASYARRTENLERLLAARVSNPCEPSKATGENELATAVQAADWREALVPVRLDDDTMVWWMTPDCKYYSANYTDPTCGWGNVQNTLDALKTASTVPHVAYQTRDALPEPPNLREWWPVKADDFKPTPEQQRFLASVCESCRAVVRAMLAKGDIPGVVKTNQS